jgi:hypothetical protein
LSATSVWESTGQMLTLRCYLAQRQVQHDFKLGRQPGVASSSSTFGMSMNCPLVAAVTCRGSESLMPTPWVEASHCSALPRSAFARSLRHVLEPTSAIDDEVVAGHVLGEVGSQVHRRVGDVCLASEAPERRLLGCWKVTARCATRTAATGREGAAVSVRFTRSRETRERAIRRAPVERQVQAFRQPSMARVDNSLRTAQARSETTLPPLRSMSR